MSHVLKHTPLNKKKKLKTFIGDTASTEGNKMPHKLHSSAGREKRLLLRKERYNKVIWIDTNYLNTKRITVQYSKICPDKFRKHRMKTKTASKTKKAYANFSLVGCTKEKTPLKGLNSMRKKNKNFRVWSSINEQ